GQSCVVEYGLRSVMHVEPGHCPGSVHGLSTLAPPSQTDVFVVDGVHAMPWFGPPRQVGAAAQVLAGQSGRSTAHGNPAFAPPAHTLLQIGHGWMPGTFGRSA